MLKFQNWLELKTTHKRFVKHTTTAGNFEVQKNHLLIGKAATRSAIIKAICDIYYTLIENLSYKELKFDQVNVQYLMILCKEIINNSHYESENDIGLRLLIQKLRGANYSAKSPKEPYGT